MAIVVVVGVAARGSWLVTRLPLPVVSCDIYYAKRELTESEQSKQLHKTYHPSPH